MTSPITGISSMATRQFLAEVVAGWQARGGASVAMVSFGGVDGALLLVA